LGIFVEKTNKRKRSRKQRNKKEQDDSCNQLENKLQWAVDEVKQILHFP
jgi:hypothetical protein